MVDRTGGIADKVGNNYEQLWTMLQMANILQGNADEIRLEVSRYEKTEFVLKKGDIEELHQAKQGNLLGKWTIRELRENGIIKAIFKHLLQNQDMQFIFVSSCKAQELEYICECAQKAVRGNTLINNAIDTTAEEKKIYTAIQDIVKLSEEDITSVLNRVCVRSMDEKGIEDSLIDKLAALMGKEHAGVAVAFMQNLYSDIIRKRRFNEPIRHEQIKRYLQDKGVVFPLPRDTINDAELIKRATERYLNTIKLHLIGGGISRSEVEDIFNNIQAAEGGGEHVLVGAAGSGKSACVFNLVHSLRDAGTPVLAFRMDRLGAVNNTKELGKAIGIETSPAFVINSAFTGEKCVLIIDQLDAVSLVSGRHEGLFDCIAELLSELRGIKENLSLHIVLVCREFDWNSDTRLRQLQKGAIINKIKLGDLNDDDVKKVLSDNNLPLGIHKAQLNLLRVPQNLSVFIQAGFSPEEISSVNAEKKIYDKYWDEKKKELDRGGSSSEWLGIICALTKEMSRTQRLSVRNELLDGFNQIYLQRMVSENILIFADERYSFAHESFYDYCFARDFIGREQSIKQHLIEQEQSLFVRSQLRQVLEYMRDDSFPDYIGEIKGLLFDDDIRIHIKDLIFAWLAHAVDLSEREWAVVYPFIRQHAENVENGETKGRDIYGVAWRNFLYSAPWFKYIKSDVKKWMFSGNDNLADLAHDCLFWQKFNGGSYNVTRATRLYSLFVGKSERWNRRLENFISGGKFPQNRTFFNLFFHVCKQGIINLDHSFLAYSIQEISSEWGLELLEMRLMQRRDQLLQITGKKLDYKDMDLLSGNAWHECVNTAYKVPSKYVERVLPTFLEILDVITNKKDKPPKEDKLRLCHVHYNSSISNDAFLNALVAAIKNLPITQLDEIIKRLERREGYVENYLLLNVYTAHSQTFADKAARLLAGEPWRFDCGYSGFRYWVAMELIKNIFPYCSIRVRQQLTDAIINYAPRIEPRYCNFAIYQLLSAIPVELRDTAVEAKYDELRREFGDIDKTPRGLQVVAVQSPNSDSVAEQMTDEQWLKDINKYNYGPEGMINRELGKGSALELSRQLERFTKQQPSRFAKLALCFSESVHPYYFSSVLRGISETDINDELRWQVCGHTFKIKKANSECMQSIANCLQYSKKLLSDEMVGLLSWLATNHPDPKNCYNGNDILTSGLNTCRGGAADVISNLIGKEPAYIDKFKPAIECLVSDKNLGVRAWVAYILINMNYYDYDTDVLFERLCDADERLLGERAIYDYCYRMLAKKFNTVKKQIYRMCEAGNDKAAKNGAMLMCLAALHGHNEAKQRVAELALSPHSPLRAGVAEIAQANITNDDCRAWCEENLLILFNDKDTEVRKIAAQCMDVFRGKNASPDQCKELIGAFCASNAFMENDNLWFWLEQSSKDISRIMAGAGNMVLQKIDKLNRNDHFWFFESFGELVIRAYQQSRKNKDSDLCNQYMDMIDQLYLRNISINTELEKIEK